MSREHINEWIGDFVLLWKNHNIEAILDLFDEIEQYYEGPFSEAVSSREDIKKLWVDIVYQDVEDLEVDLIALDTSITVMHWYLKYKDTRDSVLYEMDGIYQVAFNELGKCKYFKQWWVINE
jgi:hypothetical protein